MSHKIELEIGGRLLCWESGKVAGQADGARAGTQSGGRRGEGARHGTGFGCR